MKTFFAGLGGGKVVLNPPDVFSFVANSPSKAAGIVFDGDDVIVSTEPMTPHDVMMDYAGVEDKGFDLALWEPGSGSIRAGMNAEGISVDVWMHDDAEGFPYSHDRLQALLDYVTFHRRMKRLPDTFEIELVIYDTDFVAAFSFVEEGLFAIENNGSNRVLVEPINGSYSIPKNLILAPVQRADRL